MRQSLAIVILAFVMSGLAWYHGNRHGRESVEARYRAELEEHAARADALAVQIVLLQTEAKKATGQKVRTIYVEKDPTGCADTAVPTGMLDTLRADAY